MCWFLPKITLAVCTFMIELQQPELWKTWSPCSNVWKCPWCNTFAGSKWRKFQIWNVALLFLVFLFHYHSCAQLILCTEVQNPGCNGLMVLYRLCSDHLCVLGEHMGKGLPSNW